MVGDHRSSGDFMASSEAERECEPGRAYITGASNGSNGRVGSVMRACFPTLVGAAGGVVDCVTGEVDGSVSADIAAMVQAFGHYPELNDEMYGVWEMLSTTWLGGLRYHPAMCG